MSDITHTESYTSDKPKNKPTPFGWGSIALITSIIVAGIIIGLQLSQQNQAQPDEGRAPDFEFTTFDGETYKLSDFRGNVVIINFWASWCSPCRAEAPELQAAWEAYQDQNVIFLGIAYADNGPRSLEFLEEYGITYMNAPDIGTRISEDYNIKGVPETFIVNQDGNIDQFIFAGVTEFQLSGIIDRLLEERDNE